MSNTQYAMLFKQRKQALLSMIYFPFMTKIILYVQLATLCSHKKSQNMGLFNKKPFGGARFFVPKRGAIERGGGWGGMILHSGWGGHWHGEGALARGEDGRLQKQWPWGTSEFGAPCGCMQVAENGKCKAVSLGCQAHAPAPTSHPQSALFCTPMAFVVHRGNKSTWCEFVCRHGSCLLTKRGSKEHRHHPKRTKVGRQHSMQTWGVPKSPF